MSGKLNGVQVYVRQKHPHAVYVHCGARSLNLAMSEACSIALTRNCMTPVVNRFIIKKIYACYNKHKWAIIFSIT
jgi:hypothetical protein